MTLQVIDLGTGNGPDREVALSEDGAVFVCRQSAGHTQIINLDYAVAPLPVGFSIQVVRMGQGTADIQFGDGVGGDGQHYDEGGLTGGDGGTYINTSGGSLNGASCEVTKVSAGKWVTTKKVEGAQTWG